MTSTSEPIIKKNLGSMPFHQTELEEINYNRQFIYLFFKIFIYLSVLGLSCGTWDL